MTGNEKSLVPPREFEEWEYGTNEDVAYSGFKLIGDYPFAESGRKDSENDNYGTSVDIKGDLMIVGSPHHKYDQYGSGVLTNAGAVFTYRRKSIELRCYRAGYSGPASRLLRGYESRTSRTDR